MNPSVQLICLSRSLSPCTHQLGTVGNESILNSEPVRTPLGVRSVPVLSGNALRHRLIRGPAAKILVEAWALAGKLSKDELNLLFHGGLRRESSPGVSLARTAAMERLFPMLRLLGCCLPDDIYPGSLYAYRGMLVCRENESRIRALLPEGWADESLSKLAPASSFVARWQYVRSEARLSVPELKPSDAAAVDAAGGGSEMMPFAGTCVMAGAEWLHGFTVRYADDLLLGCLLSAIERWQDDGATIGGQASRGHGRLKLSTYAPQVETERCLRSYAKHVQTVRDEAVELLHSFYRPRAAAPVAESPSSEAAEPAKTKSKPPGAGKNGKKHKAPAKART